MKKLYVLVFIFLQGCASQSSFQAYEGSRLADSSQAILLGTPCRGSDIDYTLLFFSVDGISADNYFGGYENGCRFPSEILLKPGVHQIRVFYMVKGNSHQFINFCFIAEAGKKYGMTRKVNGYNIYFRAFELEKDTLSKNSEDRKFAKHCYE